MNFSKALELLEDGAQLYREGWNGKDMWIRLQQPANENFVNSLSTAYMTAPYIYMKTVDGKLVPWLASQTDLLSKDWEESII